MFRIILAFAAALTLTACAELTEAEDTPSYPAISRADAMDFSFMDCGRYPADFNQFPRSPVVEEFNGYKAHIVFICAGSNPVDTLVFWSKTNEDFSRIMSNITTLDGRVIPYTDMGRNADEGWNSFDFAIRGRTCTVIKPRNGIAPSPLVAC